ncbi:nitroreductase [Bacilli bacterium PM5-3]|nr:nitroreductase [Bacilli bacterium PM5-3]
MNFFSMCKERYSVRKFLPNKVEKIKIKFITEAASFAPTAVNYQPQRILVLESEESLAKVKECTPYHFNAPLTFLICYDKKTSWKDNMGKDSGIVDASIVVTHLMFAALEQGLGSTWVGSFDYDKVRKLFSLPDYLEPVAFLPMGYPADDSRPSQMHKNRLDLAKTVFFESFEKIEPAIEHGNNH